MRYIIATHNDGSFEIDTITDQPKEYVSNFEPIDAVNGVTGQVLVVVDSLGRLRGNPGAFQSVLIFVCAGRFGLALG